MSFEIPDDLYYLETHEWVRFDDGSAEQSSAGDQSSTGGTARIGISDFAQDELGDVVFVELPDEGDTLAQEDQFGVIESIKAVSDLYSPVSGTVSAVNETLFDAPELVNEDPYEDGWMLELEGVSEDDAESLLSPDEYREQIE